jgi:hypothetical protein
LAGSPNTTVGPDGDPDPNLPAFYDVIPAANHAALIGRIGHGEPFVVGARSTFDVQDDFGGRFYLGINDNGVDNNSGHFTATVTVDHSPNPS